MTTAAVGLVLAAMPLTAEAATITSARFTGGSGTYTAPNGTVYARSGQSLTLTVGVDAATRCVRVTGPDSYSAVRTQAPWTFSVAAGGGNGTANFTVTAGEGVNNAGDCNKQLNTASASYVMDNTGPVLAGTTSPTPNLGWNKSNATVTWSATDTGSGVASGPTPASASVTSNTGVDGQVLTASATDRVGNPGNGTTVVKLDKVAPTVTAGQSPAANAAGWNNTDVTVSYECTDALSGIASCSAPSTLTGSGTVSGTASDVAGNIAGVSRTVQIDKAAPQLSGAPVGAPDGTNGWYTTDVRIAWQAGDALSGLSGPVPGPSTITGEGTGLIATASVSDRAGNGATATSAPSVKIDRTAPVTSVSARAGWSRTAATVRLSGTDNLSGVAGTRYSVDGGPVRDYTDAFTLDEGDHSLSYWSVDNAGNTETANTTRVRVDSSAPTIGHALSPLANANGWHNTDVTVTFSCSDNLSGVVVGGCGPDATVSTQGAGQQVQGTATDAAGNTAVDTATVSVDKDAPAITAEPDRSADRNGWYDRDVTVAFRCEDGLSGVGVLRGGTDCPGAVVLGEGRDQSAVGSVSDAAGNSASAHVSGIHVDETAPVLTGSPSHTGWVNHDVTVTWECSDALSGIDGACPADSVLDGEGAGLAANAEVLDLAGNPTSASVGGIRIDRTAPVTTAELPPLPAGGWYRGHVTVSLDAVDPLSGVASTYYSVDGDAPQEYAGAFQVGDPGHHSVVFWSTDRAGNVEPRTASNSVDVDVDDQAPSIVGSRTPANRFGWNNGPVQVSFECADAHSGLAGSCGPDATVQREGLGQSVTGEVEDVAGNRRSATVQDINIDTTAPTLTGAATTRPNDAGWYRGDVVVAWHGEDGLSGIDPDTQPESSTITGEGDNLGAGPVTVADKAGNLSQPAEVGGIKIDRTAPEVTGAPVTGPNTAGWYRDDVTVAWRCTDGLSGVAGGCPADSVIRGEGEDLSAGVTVSDVAGNPTVEVVRDIDIDRTGPTVTDRGAVTLPTGSNGWYTEPVSVRFEASDGLSGLAVSQPTTWAASSGYQEGPNATVHSGQAWDRAGNAAATTSGPYKVDLTDPSRIEISGGPVDGGTYTTLNVPAQPSCTAYDGGSGLAGCVVTGYSAAVGSHTLTASATDNAGRTARVVRTYTVRPAYTAKGYTAPVDMGGVVNTVKGGSTVPLKFQVYEGTTEMTSTSVVTGIAVRQSSCSPTAAVDAIEVTSSGGTSLRYDALAGQFVYNWQTPKTVGTCYSTTVTLSGGGSLTALFKTR